MNVVQTFWASVFVFGLLILIHELGHFLLAKRVGIKVHEFSLGFGPRLAGFTFRGTTYNLRLVPLGGFVRMAGMDPQEEVEDERSSFQHKSVGQRAAVIAAGPLMNFFLAAVLLAVIFFSQGFPVPTTTVARLVPGQPAEKAGLLPGDRITAVNGQPVKSWEEMTRTINAHPGQRIVVTVEREGRTLDLAVVTTVDERGRGKIGIYPRQELQRLNPLAALLKGAEYTARLAGVILLFVGKMVVGAAPPEIGGPVRIVQEIHTAVQMGVYYLLQLAAFLSVNLALFNLLPIPALDGSRLLFLAAEAVRGKPLDPAKENFIHLIGFGLLILLIVFITYRDILQLM